MQRLAIAICAGLWLVGCGDDGGADGGTAGGGAGGSAASGGAAGNGTGGGAGSGGISGSGGGAGQSCTTPASDVTLQPGQDIQAAVDANPEGTSFLLAKGVHRLQTIAPKTGNAFYGELDASCNRLTTLNGARLLTSWTAQGALWVHDGQDQQGQVHGDCEPGWERCNRPEDLFVDDVALQHVSSVGEVGPGKWYFDYDADTVTIGDDPAGRTLEIGTARVAFSPSSPKVKIQGLIIEKYAIPPQMGAIGDQYAQPEWEIVSNEVRLNHGTGINAGARSVVSGNHVHHNGQKGIGAVGEDVLIEQNEIAYNNTAHVDAGWEAGGTKFALTTRLVVRRNCVHHNRGPGLWTDIDNLDVLYEENVVFSNRGIGIFHEISFDAVIRDNIAADNGQEFAWLYGAQILVSTSKNVQVSGNQLFVSATHGNAIGVVWQNRGNGYAATGNSLHDNDVTFLGDAPVWQGVPGLMGVAADFAPATTDAFLQNSMNANRYHMKDSGARHFAWNNATLSFSELQAAGQESAGSVDSSVTALEPSCALVAAD
jgi:hypothetical protein